MPARPDASRHAPARGPVLVIGTGSVHVRRYVAGLVAAGQKVVVLSDAAEPFASHELLLEQRRVDFSMKSIGTSAAIRSAIGRWRPRVVHSHQANSVSWHAARGVGGSDVPLVVTIWGSDVLVIPKQGWLKRRMVRSALRAADLWTADAAHLVAAAEDVAGTTRPAAIIPIGVDSLPDESTLWSCKEDRVLSCRLHKPLYRVDRIIESFAAIASRQPAWRLEVAASGDESDRLVALARSGQAADRIEFVGQLTPAALQSSYSRARVYVSFPTSDGTSVSLLEAMAAGCYPVVSDLPANREWIVDGVNGRVVGDAGDLAAAIEEAMAISRSNEWQQGEALANRRQIEARALFKSNIAEFVRRYEGLRR